jgi:Ca2+-binding RTX toxin-like protein
VVSSAVAATIVGTPKNDVLRGTKKADKLLGKGGNDKLLGLAGNDLLDGGSGADTLKCGPGRDTAVADAADKVGPDCETVKGSALPSASIAEAAVVEGNAGTATLSFPVTLSKPVTWAVSVVYATANGSATAPGDYASASGTVTFAPGETSKAVAVSVVGDTAIEPDESLSVQISSPVNTTIAAGSATGTIKNDDKPKPRAGRWTGMTSQNRAIQFDVAPDASYLTAVRFSIDLECPGIKFQDEVIDFGDARIPLRPDWTFAVNGSDASGDVSLTFSFGGIVSPSGSAAGTLRFDFRINTPYGLATCSTENVTWRAT